MSEYAAWPADQQWPDHLGLSDAGYERPHNFHPLSTTAPRRPDLTRHAAASCIKNLQALYINLDKELGRLHFVQEQLASVGIVGQRIGAVDGSRPLPPELARYFSASHVMSAGALGCYASHIKAWQEITLQRLPHALVLEDDAILDLDLACILEDLLRALPPDWDMVHLSAEPERAVRPVAKLTDARTLVQYSRIPPGTAGYLISAAGAEKMLLAEAPRTWPVDTDTRRPWLFCLNVYGLTTAPIRQNRKIPSTIQPRGRKPRTRRRGLRAAFGNPIRNLESFLFNSGRLGPCWWWRCLIINGLWKSGALLRSMRRRHLRWPLRWSGIHADLLVGSAFIGVLMMLVLVALQWA